MASFIVFIRTTNDDQNCLVSNDLSLSLGFGCGGAMPDRRQDQACRLKSACTGEVTEPVFGASGGLQVRKASSNSIVAANVLLGLMLSKFVER